MKYFTLLALVAIIILGGCKQNDETDDNIPVDSMKDLVVDQSFNWTAALEGYLDISLINPYNASTDKEIINIVDAAGNIVKRTRVSGTTASFYLKLPQNASYFVQFPVTGDLQEITAIGPMEMTLGETIVIDPLNKSTNDVESCTSCESPIVNPGGELPVIPNKTYRILHQDQVPGWETTATDKRIEVWSDLFLGVPAQEGRQFFELNANMVAHLYQELCLNPGSIVHWSVWHRGRAGTDVAEVKIGGTIADAEVQTVMTDGNTAWGHYEGTYVVPEGQETTYFVFTSVSSAGSNSVGNFLDNFEITCDYDGDGIPDNEDDNPEDPNIAYITHYPSSGKEVVAFEDLWPSVGDFDFNDVVLSNQATISWSPALKPVKAEFKVSIDAIGATINNGIGLMFYNNATQAFGSNIIESVEGDATVDSQVANGVILTNNVFEAISKYYKNNGQGPTAIPDTLSFTVNFNAYAGEFIPELYIFRTDNRSYEIHRAEFPTTPIADQNMFNTVNDAGHYKTENGLPWGMSIILEGQYKNPVELIDMLLAYPDFQLWATSNGAQNTTWYENPVADKVVDIN